MPQVPEQDLFGRDLFLVGEHVPAGRYKHIDGPQIVVLQHNDILPADLDGHATCYICIQIWSDIRPIDLSSVPRGEATR